MRHRGIEGGRQSRCYTACRGKRYRRHGPQTKPTVRQDATGNLSPACGLTIAARACDTSQSVACAVPSSGGSQCEIIMANSKYEYVKNFEQDAVLLPECWIVVRVDGKGFTKFCDAHGFQKPNDARALRLMDECAVAVMQELGDIVLAFGESDEYSFVFRKQTTLYKRRSFKLVSVLVSLFTGSYVRLWSQYLPDVSLQYTPMFDARAVCYPNNRVLRDYLSWRQVTSCSQSTLRSRV